MHEAYLRLAAVRLVLGRRQVQLMGKQTAATMAIGSDVNQMVRSNILLD